MHVVIVYPSVIPMPPPLYGGGQRVMAWLAKGLIQLGHRVTLIGHAKSHVPGAEVRPVSRHSAKDSSWVSLVPADADILHLRQMPVVRPPKPFVITLGSYLPREIPIHPNTIFVSRKHAELYGSRHFVHNGLDLDDYQCHAEREDYAVFLAKARWPRKNLVGAIEICRRAKIPLHVIGSTDWPLGLHRWVPTIRGVRYHGRLGQKDKCPLLAKARCLIFPVRWHEPFGNAVSEALASGCFIAGTPYGALPELVTEKVGLLSADADHLIEAVSSTDRFNPADCRLRVQTGGFTHLEMARRYLAYYEKMLTDGRLGELEEPIPRLQPDFDPLALLPWRESGQV